MADVIESRSASAGGMEVPAHALPSLPGGSAVTASAALASPPVGGSAKGDLPRAARSFHGTPVRGQRRGLPGGKVGSRASLARTTSAHQSGAAAAGSAYGFARMQTATPGPRRRGAGGLNGGSASGGRRRGPAGAAARPSTAGDMLSAAPPIGGARSPATTPVRVRGGQNGRGGGIGVPSRQHLRGVHPGGPAQTGPRPGMASNGWAVDEPASGAPAGWVGAESRRSSDSAGQSVPEASGGNSPPSTASSGGGSSEAGRPERSLERGSSASSASSAGLGAPHTNGMGGFGIVGGNTDNSAAAREAEVLRLREDVRQLKLAFLSKLRGGDKFVSGGQFRAGRQGNQAADRTQERNLRSALAKAKAEAQGSKRQAAELQARVAEYERHIQAMQEQFREVAHTRAALDEALRRAKRAEDESAAHQDEATRALNELSAAAEATERARAEAERQRQAAQSQRDLVASLEEANAKLLRRVQELEAASRTPDSPPPRKAANPTSPATLERIGQLEREVVRLEDALRDSAGQLADETARREAVTASAEATRTQLADAVQQLGDARERVKELEGQNADLAARSRQLEDDAGAARAAAAAAQQQLAAAQAELKAAQDDNVRKRARVAELEGQLDEAQRRLGEADAAAAASRAELEQQLKEERERAAAAEAALSAAQKELEAACAAAKGQPAIDALQRRIAELEAAAEATRAELQALMEALAAATELARQQRERADAAEGKLHDLRALLTSAREDVSAAEQTATSARDAKHALQERLNELQAQLRDAERAVEDMAESSQRALQNAKAEALEKTLQSMVRLCVVAPTVNVQIGSNDALRCRPRLPRAQLEELIQREVLPGFVATFLQEADSTAPDGSPLEGWLRALAMDMQASIEKHLQAQFAPDEDDSWMPPAFPGDGASRRGSRDRLSRRSSRSSGGGRASPMHGGDAYDALEGVLGGDRRGDRSGAAPMGGGRPTSSQEPRRRMHRGPGGGHAAGRPVTRA